MTGVRKGPRGRGRVFVISSPSGGGKTTVVAALLRRRPELRRSVSVTTRPARRGERRGAHYHFVSPAQFRRMRKSGGLLEWAKVHDAYYGTPKAPLRRAVARGRSVVLSIDVQGARQIRRALGRRAVLVFVLPPSLRDLRRRLMRRRTESLAAIRRRLAVAQGELRCAAWYDYGVVNDRVTQAVARLEAIVIAEQCRIRGTRT